MQQRKANIHVYELQDEQGQTYRGFESGSNLLQKYYKALLSKDCKDRSPIDPHVIQLGATLPVDLQFQLCAPFSGKDIKEAMFSISNLKSPDPDGFSSGFFKASWHLTGSMICEANQKNFRTSHLPSYIGHTKMVLRPKVPNPT